MLDPAAILDKLDRLRAADRGYSIFGSDHHRYVLRPPLPAEKVAALEARHGVTLPEDYRVFLTEVGNGGAGPYYGLLPLGEQDDGGTSCKWEEGSLVGDIAAPFRHEGPWNLPEEFWAQAPEWSDDMPEEEQDRLMEEWDDRLETEYWAPAIMNGAIPICHLGCALRHWLVVTGTRRGEVWYDHRVDEGGIGPLIGTTDQPVTFETWYMGWLDEGLARLTQTRGSWLARLLGRRV